MFNSFLGFSQKYLNYLYKNSLLLQKVDLLILAFIMLTFISSTFMNSDSIGFFAIIVIFLTVIKLLTKPDEKVNLKSFELWLLIYFLIVVVSLFGSSLFSLSLKGFFKTFIYIGYYFCTVNYLKNNSSKIPLIIGTIAVCVSVESLIGCFQSTLHLSEISTWQDTSRLNPEDVLSRVYGTLKPLNPNLFGGYLVCGLPAVMGMGAYLFIKQHFKSAIGFLIYALITIYAILQTGCRGAYLAMILVLGAVFILSAKFFWNTYKKIYLSVSGFLFCAFILGISFVTALRKRFISIFAMRNDSSNSFRFNVYQSSWQMFKDNWLLGIGVGNKNFREIYGLYMKTGFDALSAYNIYLETAVESGIFALIAFLGYLISLSYCAVKFVLKNDDNTKIIFVAFSLIAIWGVMFHGLVDTIYFRPQLQFMFWTYTAVICTLLPDSKIIGNKLLNR